MMFHWKYADERSMLKGQIGWYVAQIANPDQAPQIAHAIDEKFANSPYETKTDTERAFQSSFVSMFGNLNLLLGSIALAVVITHAVRGRQYDGDVGARADDRNRGDADAWLSVGDDLPARCRRRPADVDRSVASLGAGLARVDCQPRILASPAAFIPDFGVNNANVAGRPSGSASSSVCWRG